MIDIDRMKSWFKKMMQSEVRAFDWVSLLLYAVAIGSMFWSLWEPLFGAKEASGAILSLLEVPNERAQAGFSAPQSNIYRAILVVFSFFIMFVYVRNYIVMQAIDNRISTKKNLYYFVDSSYGPPMHFERIFRVAIILWVMVSPLGLYPPVSKLILNSITFIGNLHLNSEKEMLAKNFISNLNFFDFYIIYYAAVVSILFLLFFCWDCSNVALAKKAHAENNEELDDSTLETSLKLLAEKRGIPENLIAKPAVISLLAYILPTWKVGGGDTNATAEDETDDTNFNKLQSLVREGGFWQIYLSSQKFFERVAGFAIGILLFTTSLLNITVFGDLVGAVVGVLLTGSIVFYATVVASTTKDTFSSILSDLLGYLCNDHSLVARIARAKKAQVAYVA